MAGEVRPPKETADMVEAVDASPRDPTPAGARTSTVLIVDDEESVVWALRRVVESMGLEAVSAPSAERALGWASDRAPELVLLDVHLPGMNGLRALAEFGRVAPEAKVVIMTAHGSLDAAIAAQRQGAWDYLPKPLDAPRVRTVIRSALGAAAADAGVQMLRGGASAPSGLVGRSPAMQDLFRQVAAVTASNAAVLLVGESGTGKELVARAIHRNGPRAAGPFEAINCAAIPETLLESELYGHARGAFTGAEREKPGRLEIAGGGTVFLDEVGDLSPAAQVKLLRFLEDRRLCRVGGTEAVDVDVRVISATHRDLDTGVRQGHFREDLLFRLNVVRIVVPPLRSREGDLPLLVAHYLDRVGGAGITEEAMSLMSSYSWPGNVRELRNAVERGTVLARRGLIRPEHLPDPLRSPRPSGDADVEAELRTLVDLLAAGSVRGEVFACVEASWEKALLGRVLEVTGGNRFKAAELLGITRTTLKRRMEKYGL